MEGFISAFVLIRQVSFVYPEYVNFEGIDRFKGLLPSLLLERNLAFLLFTDMGEIDIEFRTVNRKIANQAEPDQFSPVDCCNKPFDIGHGRFRISILRQDQIPEIQGERKGMEIGSPDLNRVSL